MTEEMCTAANKEKIKLKMIMTGGNYLFQF